MPTLNPHNRELSFKLVFYGPGLGGKTTTLKTLFASTKAENRGKMVSVATQQDRTLHFDFLPLRVPRVRGMTVRLQLYTVPGQLYYGATRKLLLSGVDGVVFVADSQEGRLEPNQESLDDLKQNLAELKRPFETLPHTFHWNKRDLSDLVPIEELEGRFNPHGAPSIGTIATTGEGVFEGLERITRLVLRAHEGEELDARPLLGIMEDPGGIAHVLQTMVESAPSPTKVAEQGAAHAPSSAHAQNGVAKAPSIPEPELVPSPPPVSAAPAGVGARSGTPSEVPEPQVPFLDELDDLSPSPPGVIPVIQPKPKIPFQTTEGGTALSVQAPEGIAVEPLKREIVSDVPPVPSPPTALPDEGPALTFRHLFSGAQAERRAVELCEAHLARGEAKAAILACDVALSRLLATVAASLGSQSAPKDPALVAYLLGLEGPRYLAFRALVRAARKNEPVTLAAAFEAFLLLLEANRLREATRPAR